MVLDTKSPALGRLHTIKLQAKKSPRWGVAGLKGCSLGAEITIDFKL